MGEIVELPGRNDDLQLLKGDSGSECVGAILGASLDRVPTLGLLPYLSSSCIQVIPFICRDTTPFK